MKKILKKQTLNSRYSDVHLYQILVNLENFCFWDQICPKNTLVGELGKAQPSTIKWMVSSKFRWFQVVFGWFQLVSGDFRSLLVLVSTEQKFVPRRFFLNTSEF